MNLIAAVNDDWGIGCRGTQTIVIPADRKHFKETTLGAAVITGRTSLADFPGGRPLPGRMNIVLSRDTTLAIDGATVVNTLAALHREVAALEGAPVFVIGGGSVYNLLLPYCTRAYITRIYASPESDTFLPNLDKLPNWSLVSRGERQVTADGTPYSFDIYENNAPMGWEEIPHV